MGGPRGGSARDGRPRGGPGRGDTGGGHGEPRDGGTRGAPINGGQWHAPPLLEGYPPWHHHAPFAGLPAWVPPHAGPRVNKGGSPGHPPYKPRPRAPSIESGKKNFRDGKNPDPETCQKLHMPQSRRHERPRSSHLDHSASFRATKPNKASMTLMLAAAMI